MGRRLAAALIAGVLGCGSPSAADEAAESPSTDAATSDHGSEVSTSEGSATSSSETGSSTGETGPSTSDTSETGTSETSSSETSETSTSETGTSETEGDAVCGDGILGWGEDCDDGNLVAADGCEDDCKYSVPAKKVVTGLAHTCVLFHAGQVKCWGLAEDGQLGYANTQDIGELDTPDGHGFVDIGGSAVDIEGGGDTTCVLFDDASIGCWGEGTAGALGYANVDNVGDDETPASAGKVYVGGPVTGLSGGNGRMCAVLADASLRCWGYNNMGQLGYGYTQYVGDDETPAEAGPVPLGGGVQTIASAMYHSCALLEDGSVRCWGLNADGELGQADTEYVGDDEPASAVPPLDLGGIEVAALACGGYHCCALTAEGEVACWGDNAHGQLGYGHTQDIGDDETPASAGFVDVGAPVLEMGAEFHATCVRIDAGIKCWGANAWGQLGYGQFDLLSLGDDEVPASYGLVDVGDAITGLSDGCARHICGVTGSGRLRCWGAQTQGQLGHGIMEFALGDDEVPASLPVVPFY